MKHIRIQFTRSGEMLDADNNGLGYGLLYTDQLVTASQDGCTFEDYETGNELSIQDILKGRVEYFKNETGD